MASNLPPPPHGEFGVIYADPPWAMAMRSPKGEGRSACQHYGTMSLEEIKALPLAFTGARDCMLLMWVIDPMLPQALEVISAWGFTLKTVGFYWEKLNADGSPFMGTGYWTRANPEQCWLATRGSPKRLSSSVRRLVREPRREHSRKPERIYGDIERLVAGPYLELFGRQQRPGWTVWGDQNDHFACPAAPESVVAG